MNFAGSADRGSMGPQANVFTVGVHRTRKFKNHRFKPFRCVFSTTSFLFIGLLFFEPSTTKYLSSLEFLSHSSFLYTFTITISVLSQVLPFSIFSLSVISRIVSILMPSPIVFLQIIRYISFQWLTTFLIFQGAAFGKSFA